LAELIQLDGFNSMRFLGLGGILGGLRFRLFSHDFMLCALA
jgi:hypothetical protein